MPITAALIGGSILAPIAGSAIGSALSSDDRELQRQALEKMMATYGKQVSGAEALNVPTLGQVDYRGPEFTGGYTPEEMQAFLAGPTAYEQVSIDPRLKSAQMQALEQMQQIGSEGFTEEDKAAMAQMQRQVAKEDRARQAAMLQNLAQRGIAGSGAELAQRLSSSQAASEQAAQSANAQAIAAAERKRQAIMAAQQIASGARGQESAEQGALASARDAIARFNAQNQQQASQFNAGQGTEANKYTAATRQDLAKTAAEYAKQAQQQNKILTPQEQYQMAAGKQGIVNNALSNLASGYSGKASKSAADAAQTQQTWNQIGSGVGKGLGAGAGYAAGARTDTGSAGEGLNLANTSKMQSDSDNLELLKKYGLA